MPGKRTWRLIAILVFIQLYAVQLLSLSMPDQQRNWTSMFSLFDLTQVILHCGDHPAYKSGVHALLQAEEMADAGVWPGAGGCIVHSCAFLPGTGPHGLALRQKNYYDPTFLYYIIDNIQYAFVTMFPGVIVFFAEESARHKERSLALEVSRKKRRCST